MKLKLFLEDWKSGRSLLKGLNSVLSAVDSSNIKSRKRLNKHMKAKSIKTMFHPKSGKTMLATSNPMKEASAVPMKRSEYTLEPSLKY